VRICVREDLRCRYVRTEIIAIIATAADRRHLPRRSALPDDEVEDVDDQVVPIVHVSSVGGGRQNDGE